MAWVVSLAGQKGGTGKSILSQALAVEAAKAGERVVLGDLDIGQRTSWEWNEARKLNNITPAIEVVLIDSDRHRDFGVGMMPAEVGLLVLDAPGWSDERTVLLAGHSDLMVLPTGASAADLRPTIRLMHELVAKGVTRDRILTALCRVRTEAEIKFARDYLKEAGYVALPGVMRDMPDFRKLQTQGYAAVEANGEKMRGEVAELIGSIRGALDGAKALEHGRPERFVAEPLRFKGRGR